VLGRSDDELAADLAVTPGIVRGWSGGTTPIPRRHAQQIAFLAATAQRADAVQRLGLQCEWLTAQERTFSVEASDFAERAAAIEQHVRSCPTCIARERYLADHFGPMPPLPQPAWVRLLAWGSERIPAWLRPAALSALLLAAIVSLRVVFAIPFLLSSPRKLIEALVAIVAAAGAGAMGGLAYTATRPWLKRLGRAGDYLTGIVCVVAYMSALALVAPIAFGQPLIKGQSDAIVFVSVSIFFGLVVGHIWFAREQIPA